MQQIISRISKMYTSEEVAAMIDEIRAFVAEVDEDEGIERFDAMSDAEIKAEFEMCAFISMDSE